MRGLKLWDPLNVLKEVNRIFLDVKISRKKKRLSVHVSNKDCSLCRTVSCVCVCFFFHLKFEILNWK